MCRQERNAARLQVLERDAQLRSLETDVKALKGELASLKVQVKGLEELGEKQKRTIKIQSDQIAAKAETNVSSWRNPGAGTRFPQPPGQPRSFGDVQIAMRPATAHEGAVPPGFPGPPFWPASQVDPNGERGSAQSNGPWDTKTSSDSRRPSLQTASPDPIFPPPWHQQSSNEVRALAITEDPLTSSTGTSWQTEFSAFFASTEAWARNYCNVPTSDSPLPSALLRSLKDYSSPTTALPLLESSGTRYLLVSSLLNRWITHDIFRFHIVRGFSSHYDNEFRQLRQGMDACPDQLTVQRGLQQATAEVVTEMRNDLHFPGFVSSLASMRTETCFASLRPLLAPSAVMSNAVSDLQGIFKEGLRIGFLMASEASRFEFDYPTTRPVTWFHSGTMINKDPVVSEDGVSLEKKGRKVRLGVSPCIRVTRSVFRCSSGNSLR